MFFYHLIKIICFKYTYVYQDCNLRKNHVISKILKDTIDYKNILKNDVINWLNKDVSLKFFLYLKRVYCISPKTG